MELRVFTAQSAFVYSCTKLKAKEMQNRNSVSVLTQLILSCGFLVLVTTIPTTTLGETKGYVEDFDPVDEELDAPTSRIVGGKYAADGQFPHQISLYIFGDFTCGGSIISANYVVTAAHCVTSKPGSK